MGLIRFYLRNFIRSGFRPINQKVAKRWELRTSLFYLFIGFSSFAYSCYAITDCAKSGNLGDARAFDPVEYMKKFGTKDEFNILEVDGTEVKRKTFTAAELDNYRQDR